MGLSNIVKPVPQQINRFNQGHFRKCPFKISSLGVNLFGDFTHHADRTTVSDNISLSKSLNMNPNVKYPTLTTTLLPVAPENYLVKPSWCWYHGINDDSQMSLTDSILRLCKDQSCPTVQRCIQIIKKPISQRSRSFIAVAMPCDRSHFERLEIRGRGNKLLRHETTITF